jgi:hypothetical protein
VLLPPSPSRLQQRVAQMLGDMAVPPSLCRLRHFIRVGAEMHH